MTSAWAVAALGVAGLVALPARAEDADKLVADAEALVAKGDYEHACPKLREAAKAKPALETLAALADCDDKAGNKASAYQEYDELIPRAKAAYADDLAKKATERKAALAGELAKVVLVVPKTTRLTYTIELDGVVLSADRIGVELLLAAGKHHLKVTTNGAPDTQMDTDFEVPGKLARSTVTIPLDRPGDAVAPAAQPAGNGQPAGQQTIVVQGSSGFGPPTEPQVPMKNNPGMIAGGSLLIVAGVASIFTSAGFGIASIWNDDYGTAAWGFFIGGLIGIGAGIPIVVVGAVKHPVQDASAGRLQAAIPELRIGPGSLSAKWAF